MPIPLKRRRTKEAYPFRNVRRRSATVFSLEELDPDDRSYDADLEVRQPDEYEEILSDDTEEGIAREDHLNEEVEDQLADQMMKLDCSSTTEDKKCRNAQPLARMSKSVAKKKASSKQQASEGQDAGRMNNERQPPTERSGSRKDRSKSSNDDNHPSDLFDTIVDLKPPYFGQGVDDGNMGEENMMDLDE